MPGIAGLVTRLPRHEAEPRLRSMVQVLNHQSFYETGTWIDESLGVYVGWTARRGSFCANMPLLNETGQTVLVFSGEEFPDPSTRTQLKSKGHEFQPRDASYLVHVYEEDAQFPANLNGRFHGLLIDKAKGTVLLFNDRYGMQRVYVHQSEDAFYFAAEAKAILQVCPELRTIDPKGFGELVTCGCVLENRTVFRDVHVLPPGSAWTFLGGERGSRTSYFQPRDWEQQDSLDTESYYQELKHVFAKNLPRYLASDESIGMSLTGGLDSRLIMSWGKSPAGSLPCFSFGGIYRDCRDVTVARQVAKICDQPYSVIEVGDEFLSQFSKYAERTVYLSDGCADVTRAADLYANEKARSIAPVRMTGNYGSEVLRRTQPRRPMEPTPAFKPAPPPPGLFSRDLDLYAESAVETYGRVYNTHPTSFAVFRQAPWHHYGLLALEQTQLTLRSPFLDNDFVRTVYRAPYSTLTNSQTALRLISEGNAELGRLRTDRGFGGDSGPLINALARTYLEFTFKAEYAYDYGMPPFLAKIDHAFSVLHLERLFLGRHKFAHYRIWYRDKLCDYLRSTLLDPRSLSRPFIEGQAVQRIVSSHLRGSENHTDEIHKLLTLELIYRLFIDAD
jgi:asparagine synthase (glutamine-hydrolysing)